MVDQLPGETRHGGQDIPHGLDLGARINNIDIRVIHIHARVFNGHASDHRDAERSFHGFTQGARRHAIASRFKTWASHEQIGLALLHFLHGQGTQALDMFCGIVVAHNDGTHDLCPGSQDLL